ncbi:4Fe-4S dicluster domain-containing protein [uncultured Bilophila sp.]|uniref:4Fe-4S dicluster domain-containing protein n=1 Tax=uncultured Bilophila sp. TaxID=529385 RepID=UPI00280BAC38|nr:4Fe-4S dicluster domain-containing protein [uncultured Bilophila sp.]
MARWLGKIAPWRIRRTDACTRCLACTRVCRYGALTPDRLESGRPGPGCTLCRDCLSVCRHDGLAMTLYGKTYGAAESVFVVLLSIMHAVFLAVARV